MGNCAAKKRAERQAMLERQAAGLGLTGSASNLASVSAAANDIDSASSDLYGAPSGYGDGGYVYATYCPEGIPEDIALLATAAALAAGIYIIYRQILIQTAGRRKKRSRIDKPTGSAQTVSNWVLEQSNFLPEYPMWNFVWAGLVHTLADFPAYLNKRSACHDGMVRFEWRSIDGAISDPNLIESALSRVLWLRPSSGLVEPERQGRQYVDGDPLVGAASGHGDCCPPVVDTKTLLMILAFIAAAVWFLNIDITMNLGRRKRRKRGTTLDDFF